MDKNQKTTKRKEGKTCEQLLFTEVFKLLIFNVFESYKLAPQNAIWCSLEVIKGWGAGTFPPDNKFGEYLGLIEKQLTDTDLKKKAINFLDAVKKICVNQFEISNSAYPNNVIDTVRSSYNLGYNSKAIHESIQRQVAATTNFDLSSTANENYIYCGVVAFDLDGTLIRGLRHAWGYLREAAGYTKEEAIQLTDEFKRKFKSGTINYKGWTKIALEQLQIKVLTKKKIKNFFSAQSFFIAHNLEMAIKRLKQHGYAVIIISGSTDSILEHYIPNYSDLFDKVYINEFHWNDDGTLKDITPTDYDWNGDNPNQGVKGKCDAMRDFCITDNKAPLSNTVFVGDDENDISAMNLATKKIFFNRNPKARPTKLFSGGIKILAESDDLDDVVDYILEGDKEEIIY